MVLENLDEDFSFLSTRPKLWLRQELGPVERKRNSLWIVRALALRAEGRTSHRECLCPVMDMFDP